MRTSRGSSGASTPLSLKPGTGSTTSSRASSTRGSRIRQAVLNSQRAEQADYGSSGDVAIINGPLPSARYAADLASYDSASSAAGPSGSSISGSNRTRFGMSSGGGPSSFNVFSHEGQGESANPYETAAAALVAPRSFHSSSPFASQPGRSREDRLHSGASPMSSDPRGSAPSRSTLTHAGSACLLPPPSQSRPPSSSSLLAPPAAAQVAGSASGLRSSSRRHSWGGGDSSAVASILSWSGSDAEVMGGSGSGPPPAGSAYTYQQPQQPLRMHGGRRSYGGPSSSSSFSSITGGEGGSYSFHRGATSNSMYGGGVSAQAGMDSNQHWSEADANAAARSFYCGGSEGREGGRGRARMVPGQGGEQGANGHTSVKVSQPPGGLSSWTPGWG